METIPKTERINKVCFQTESVDLVSEKKLSERHMGMSRANEDDLGGVSTKFNVKDVLGIVFKDNFKSRVLKQGVKRVKQPALMYIVTLMMTMLSGSEQLYLFLWDYEGKDTYIFFPTMVFRPIFFFASSYYLSRNWKVMAKLFISFDRILVAEIAMMISVGSFST